LATESVPEPTASILRLAGAPVPSATGVRRGRPPALLAGLLAVAAASSGTPARATILLFDETRDSTTQRVVPTSDVGGTPPDDYGDYVTGTPMAVPGGFFSYGEAGEGFTPAVAVDLFSSEATVGDPAVRLDGEGGYGDLVNVVHTEGPGVGGAESLSLVLTAEPGVAVDLYGFDVAGWHRADYSIAAVAVLADALPLFSATDVPVEGDLSGPGRTTFAFDPPLRAQELLVQLDLSNLDLNVRDNIGIDNVRFGQLPRPVPEPSRALLLLLGGILLLVFHWRDTPRRTGWGGRRAAARTAAGALLFALVALTAAAAGAAKVGDPLLDLKVFGITEAPNATHFGPPGEHGPLLDFASEQDLVDGGVVLEAQIGSNSNGDPVYAEVGVANDGDTFWAFADTPNHYQNANRDYIGSEALLSIYQSYTKDTEAASLTYTFTRAELGAFINVEFGPQCQPGEEYCLRAGMVSLVEVYDAAGTNIGSDSNQGGIWSQSSSPPWGSALQDGFTAWPWVIEDLGAGGFLEHRAKLSEPVTNSVDLGDVALGQEFTVVYTLWTYALDTSADAGLFRTAEAFARDPLGGDTGVSFDLVGLTPTNNPSVRPVPEPSQALLLLLGAMGLLARHLGHGLAGSSGTVYARERVVAGTASGANA
jgi:hypothetical protein